MAKLELLQISNKTYHLNGFPYLAEKYNRCFKHEYPIKIMLEIINIGLRNKSINFFKIALFMFSIQN